jgi:hypothetical protein
MLLLLTGCFSFVLSLHPFYAAKDLVFEPALVGSWEEQQDKGEPPSAQPPQVWTFKRSESTEEGNANAYDLTVSVKDHAVSFSAHLAKVGDTLFLDLLPGEPRVPEFMPQLSESQSPEEDAGDEVMILYLLHFVGAAHSVWRVRLEGDRLQLSALNDDWVAEQAQKKTLRLRHEDVSGEGCCSGTPVLTASPKELRKFLLKHAHDDKAFVSRWTYKRQKPAPPEPEKEEPAPAK